MRQLHPQYSTYQDPSVLTQAPTAPLGSGGLPMVANQPLPQSTLGYLNDQWAQQQRLGEQQAIAKQNALQRNNWVSQHPVLSGLAGGLAGAGLNYLQTRDLGGSLTAGVMGGVLTPMLGKRLNNQAHSQAMTAFQEAQKANLERQKGLMELLMPAQMAEDTRLRMQASKDAGQINPNSPVFGGSFIDNGYSKDIMSATHGGNNAGYGQNAVGQGFNQGVGMATPTKQGQVLQGGVSANDPNSLPMYMPESVTNNQVTQYGNALKDGVSSGIAINKAPHENAKLDADASDALAKAGYSNAQTKKITALLPYELKQAIANIGKTGAETRQAETQTAQIAPNAKADRTVKYANASETQAKTKQVGKAPPNDAKLSEQLKFWADVAKQNGWADKEGKLKDDGSQGFKALKRQLGIINQMALIKQGQGLETAKQGLQGALNQSKKYNTTVTPEEEAYLNKPRGGVLGKSGKISVLGFNIN